MNIILVIAMIFSGLLFPRQQEHGECLDAIDAVYTQMLSVMDDMQIERKSMDEFYLVYDKILALRVSIEDDTYISSVCPDYIQPLQVSLAICLQDIFMFDIFAFSNGGDYAPHAKDFSVMSDRCTKLFEVSADLYNAMR